jgi:hypothetical protein
MIVVRVVIEQICARGGRNEEVQKAIVVIIAPRGGPGRGGINSQQCCW